MKTPLREKTSILLVDDNVAVLKLLGKLFAEQGMVVSLAQSAAEARLALGEGANVFDLVLSDISMPEESGFDLLSWIKRDESPFRGLPVLLTTSQLPEAENRLKGLAMGAVDYVVRSTDLRELVVRAEHAIENFKRVKSLEMSLQDSQDLALVGRLLAASHHEVKNVATLVNLAAGQVAESFAAGNSDRSAQALRRLAQATALLTDVSKNVGNLLRPEASPVMPTNISALITEVIELVGPRVKPCRVEARLTGAPVWAMVHPVRLKQVLINLVLNAYDAIQELEDAGGGAVILTIESTPERCQVQVRDNGIGFNAPGERSEFQPFATTKKLRGGQGLGLWLCATLMRNMGGQLTLRSPGVGEGATASLTMSECAAPAPDDFDIADYFID